MGIAKLASLSQICARAWPRTNLGTMSHYISRRNVQEFPGTLLDNSVHVDHLIVLPETLDDPNNELRRIPRIGERDVDYNKINAETVYKGLSQAICEFENLLADFEDKAPSYNKPEDLFKDIENSIYKLDSAYNLAMAMILVDDQKFAYKEIGQLLRRYHDVREKRCTGLFGKYLRSFMSNSNDSDKSDQRMLSIYQNYIYRPFGGRPVDDSTLHELKINIKTDSQAYMQCLFGANSLISHTIDDPDIIANVAKEYADCQDLHHKERTPLKVTPATYHKFMKVCPDRFVRRMLWETYNKRCSPKALPRFNTTSLQTSIRANRRKVASVCGYRSHLDFRLRDTMAKAKDKVLESLRSINEDNQIKVGDRLQELSDYAYDNQFEDLAQQGIQEYDIDFWSHKYTHDILIGMSQQQLTSFFPLTSVVNGVMKFFREYLSTDMTHSNCPTSGFWSPQVQFFEVKRHGDLIGNVIFDPYRSGTRKATNTMYARVRIRHPEDRDIIPTRLISVPYTLDSRTNMPHLSVIDVVNLFHCFAVVLQRLFYNYKYYELNMYGGLEQDALNLFPYICDAHMLTDHKVLQSLSSRDGKSKPIDSELARRIAKSIYYFRPLKIWNELYKAHLDLELHSGMNSSKTLAEEIYLMYSPFERFADNYDFCAMSDIFVGPNDGIKYADLWARQLATACLDKVANSDGSLDGERMKNFYKQFLEAHFDSSNLQTWPKLTSFFGKTGFEPTKSGLGVL